MTTETEAAAPQGQDAESASAPQAEAEKSAPDGQEQPGAQPEGESQQSEQQNQDGKANTPRGVQKRLDELRRQVGDAQRFNERLLSVLERTLVGGSVPKVEQPVGPPKREDFASFEEYLEARSDYQVAQTIKALSAKAEQTRAQQQQVERLAAWEAKVQAAAERYEDFADVALSPNLAISDAMAEAIRESEIGPEIAYFLGKNPAEARRISQLPTAAAQVLAIAKVGEQVKSKTAEPVKRPSKAPAPIEPVGTGKGSTASNSDPSQMTQAEYEAWRKKQGAWWAR